MPKVQLLILFGLLLTPLHAFGQTLTSDQRERYRQARDCVNQRTTVLDDGITSAEIVAGAIVSSCKNMIYDKTKPNAPDRLIRFEQESNMVSVLKEAALESVLTTRVSKAKPASSSIVYEGIRLGAMLGLSEIRAFTERSKNYYELIDGASVSGFMAVPHPSGQLRVIDKRSVVPIANREACQSEIKTQSAQLERRGFTIIERDPSYFMENWSLSFILKGGVQFERDDHRGFIVCSSSDMNRIKLERREGFVNEISKAYKDSFRRGLDEILDGVKK